MTGRRTGLAALLAVLVLAVPAAAWVPLGPGTPRGWQQTTQQPAAPPNIAWCQGAIAFSSTGSTGAGYQNDVTLTCLATGEQRVVHAYPDYPTAERLTPCSRDGGNIVYVPQWDRHVLFNGWKGGYVSPDRGYPTCIIHWDLAAYSVAQDHWDRRPIGLMKARAKAAMAYHPPSGNIIVWGGGGLGCCNTNQFQRITLFAAPDASGNWGKAEFVTMTNQGGAFPVHDVGNVMNGMVWVPPLNKFVVLTGRGESRWGLWTLDPDTKIMTALRPTVAGGVFPPYREYHAVTWDAVNQVVLLHGGQDFNTQAVFGDLWAWHPGDNRMEKLTVPDRVATHHTLISLGPEHFLLPGTNGANGVPTLSRPTYKLTLALAPPPQRTLTITTEGTGHGTTTGAGSYPHGTLVTPTAVADPGSTFDGFGPPCQAPPVTMDADYTCTAPFTELPQFPPGYQVIEQGGDRVRLEWVGFPGTEANLYDCATSPLMIDCLKRIPTPPPVEPPVIPRTLTLSVIGQGVTLPAAGATTHGDGAAVALSGTPAAGWQGPTFSGDADCSDGALVMTADRACTAAFTALPSPPTGALPAAQTWVSKPPPPGPMVAAKVLFGKHTRGAIHPASGRVYINGGDYLGLPQPDGTMVSGSQSGRQEMWRYDIGTHSAELLQHFCRVDGGMQPSSHDEFMWVWVETAQRFWAPFGYQWLQTLCPGNQGGPVQYDPATNTWATLAIPPPPGISPTSYANHAIHDPTEDVLYFVSRTGSGALAVYRYARASGAWLPAVARLTLPAFPNVKINDTLPAHDARNRAIYVITPGLGLLYRYDMATATWEDLGPIPNLTAPVQVETFPVYDTVNDVLLFPHTFTDTDGVSTYTVKLHAYTYATKTWSAQPMPAERIRARNGVFSVQHNVLMLWGWSGKLWFYRYAERP